MDPRPGKDESIHEVFERLQVHDHLCLIHDTRAEFCESVVPFIRAGIKHRNRCVYITDEKSSADILKTLGKSKVDTAKSIDSGTLIFLTKQDSYLKDGVLDPDMMIQFLEESTQKALSDGFSALRITFDMGWVLSGGSAMNRLMEYEIKLNGFLDKNTCIALCLYNRKRFSAAGIKDIIRTHPIIIYHGRIVANPFYLPPEEILGPDPASREVDYLLTAIMERARSEDTLKKSEERYHRIADSLTDYLYTVKVKNKKAVETVHGQGCTAITGYSPDELANDPNLWITMVTEEDRGAVRQQAERLLKYNKAETIEHRIINKNGKVRWVQNTPVPSFDTGGRLLFYDGVIRDITERKRAELVLCQSEERFHTLFEEMLSGCALHEIVYDDHGIPIDYITLEANREYERILKVSKESVIGKRAYEVVPDLDPEWLQIFSKVVLTGESYRYIQYASNLDKWIEGAAFKVAENRFAGTFIDITDRKKTEIALARHALLLEAIGKVQGLFIDEVNPRNAFTKILNTLLEITGSGFGFLDEILHDEKGNPYKLGLAMSNIAWDDDSRRIYDELVSRNLKFTNLDNLAGLPVLTGQAVIVNDYPHDLRATGLPSGHPPIISYLGVPLFTGGRLVGVAGLANRPGGYSEEDTTFLAPLFRVLAGIIQAVRMRTTEKENTESLRNNEDKFRTIADFTYDWEYWINPEGRFVYCSPSCKRITGYRSEEFIRDPELLVKITSPDDRDRVEQHIYKRTWGEETIDKMEFRIITKSGQERWIDHKCQRIIDKDGRDLGVRGSNRDITLRKQAEEELRESEANARAIMDASTASIVLLNRDGFVMESNKVHAARVGLSRDELLGRYIFDFFPAEVAKARRDALETVFLTGKSLSRQDERLGRWFDYTICPILDENGEVLKVAVYSQDITKQIRNEEQRHLAHQVLEAANQPHRLQSLLDDFVAIIKQYTDCEAVGIRLLDEEGNIPYQGYSGFSHEFFNLESPLSIKSDECMCIYVITGKTDPAKPFFTPGGSFYMNATTTFLATVSEVDKGRTRNVCNQTGYESVSLVPIKQGNAVIGLIHCADRRENMVPLRHVQVLQDVATHMGAAIQRALSQDLLKESLAEKEVLLREVHHRVKNNLATIIGMMNLQRQGITDPAASDAMLDLASRIKSMALVHESLYRSDNLDRIDFKDYLKALISNLRTSFGARSSNRIIIDADVHVGLDDAIPCGIIINELITNALKYAFPADKACPGTNSCEIEVSMKSDGTTYTLVVADNGIGLPAGMEHTTTKSLGLRIVRMLSEHQLGGTIEVDRSRGTRFTIRFGKRNRR